MFKTLFFKFILLGIIVLSFVVILNSQTEKENEIDLIRKLLETKVDTASKYKQNEKEAPASITVITSKEIEIYGYDTLDEVLNTIPGMYISSDRSYKYLGVRGFSRPTDYNNRVLFLINGHTTNDNYWGAGLVGSEFGMDLGLIDRIEVLRGPGSAIYGNNAMQAVINIITKKGSSINNYKIKLQTGSFGMLKGGFRFGKKYSSGIDLSLSLFGGKTEGQDLYFKDFDSPQTNYGIAEKIDGEKFVSFFCGIDYNGLSVQIMTNARTKGYPIPSFETNFNDPGSDIIDNWFFTDIQYKMEIKYNLRFKIRGFFNYSIYEGTYPYDQPDYNTKWEEKSESSLGGMEAQLLWDIKSNNRLMFGIEYKDNFRSYYKSWDEFDSYYDNNYPFKELSFYIQDEYQIFNNFIITGGFRYDKISNNKSSVTPRFAFVYSPNIDTSFKFLYGKAYRNPSIYEKYYESADEVKINPNLKPELINNFEFRWEQNLSEKILLNLSMYTYKMRDLIDQVLDPEDELLVFTNKTGLTGLGAEISMNFRFKNKSGSLSCSIQKTKNDSGLVITNSPAILFKGKFSSPLSKFILSSFELYYETGRMTLSNNMTKSFLLSNISFQTRKILKQFKFIIKIRNLFNKKYSNPAGFEHLLDSIIRDKRNFFIRVEYDF